MEEQLKKYLQDNIERCKFNLATMAIIEETLKPFEGKQITKRIETALKKALPDLLVTFEKMYSNFSLKIYKWEGNVKSKHGMYLNLGYHSGSTYGDHDPLKNGVFNLESFKSSAIGYYLDKERLEKYTKALRKVKQWVKIAEQIKNGYDDLKDDMEKLECNYILDDLLGFKKK